MNASRLVDAHQIEDIVNGRHGDPFAILGMHREGSGALSVRAFLPEARSVTVLDRRSNRKVGELNRLHDGGFFVGALPRRRNAFDYRLRVDWNGVCHEIEDPYRFPPILQELDIWLLAEGTHHRPFEQLGAHPTRFHGVDGVQFAVWAPSAQRVSVVGDFNHWDGRRHPMRLRRECGVWEIFLPGLGEGERYKYEILGHDGHLQPQKADPYGFRAELRPATASIVSHLPDALPLLSAERAAANALDAPISIYEVHLGSWRRKGEQGNQFLDYDDLATQLVAYCTEMGYTHVEFLPVSEFPFDGSWGYQPVGLYAPTSRFGRPTQFRSLVAQLHDAGIGVILDWVPGHFPSDPHGLAYFDGTHLFEHADPRQGFHRDWDTLIFNYGRNEVRNYLIGNALYWLERYGVDGLRVDAVASMLYLDYSREAHDWVPNDQGGRENLEAIGFLQQLNRIIGTERPGAIMIAEESTAWPMVTKPPEHGGLGFHYKWNMGWMNDSLEYIQRDPAYRRYHHGEITFSTVYAFDENFILPLSHDEVVHGKGSILQRMPGDEWQRFANLRAYYGFMFMHPGKKLLFMGDDFAQDREWNHDHSIDWHLLEAPSHAGVQALVSDLNRLYQGRPALHELDCEHAGFEWIDYNDDDQCVLSFLRYARDRAKAAVVICNFTPVVRHDYRIGVPRDGAYAEVLATDDVRYGGSGVHNDGRLVSEALPSHGRAQSIRVTLPPLATLVLEPTE